MPGSSHLPTSSSKPESKTQVLTLAPDFPRSQYIAFCTVLLNMANAFLPTFPSPYYMDPTDQVIPDVLPIYRWYFLGLDNQPRNTSQVIITSFCPCIAIGRIQQTLGSNMSDGFHTAAVDLNNGSQMLILGWDESRVTRIFNSIMEDEERVLRSRNEIQSRIHTLQREIRDARGRLAALYRQLRGFDGRWTVLHARRSMGRSGEARGPRARRESHARAMRTETTRQQNNSYARTLAESWYATFPPAGMGPRGGGQ